jgi:alpha-D-ribose 1-methylphosphonate 5-triphosphate diphosphatase
MPEHVITNAKLILADEIVSGSLRVDDASIAAIDSGGSTVAAAEDWSGDYLLPGLVELHTDNLEKHLEPRPGVRWPAMPALLTHDSQVSTAGITTVLDAMGIGDFDERSVRTQGLASTMEALRHAREHGLLRAEHLLHLRCEVACDNVVDVAAPYLEDASVRLVSLMDHTPGQRQWVDVEQFRVYTQRNQKWSDEHLAQVVAGRLDMQQRNSVRNRSALIELCAARKLTLASHDDTTEAHVKDAADAGMRISEFPTTEVAAQAARRLGLSIVMGAPNMVRGGSHSGNISTKALAMAGLLDCLSSDYVPHALLHAAFMLHSAVGWTLPHAVEAVTGAPARLVKLTDRGELAVGKRADYVRVRLSRGVPVVIETTNCIDGESSHQQMHC